MKLKRLFFDIETSYCTGWFWRPSFKTSISYDQILSNAQIICICYKWAGSDKIHSIKWDKGDDKELIKKFSEVLLTADEIIGHNSDKFDLKWVRTRCLSHGAKGLPEFKSIDTVKIARSKFNFPSNRLDAIGKYLGFGGKKDTGGIQLWHDIIQKNSAKAMRDMITYCKRDVDLLEKVYDKIIGFTPHKTNLAVKYGGSLGDCPHCASDKTVLRQTLTMATGLKKIKFQCKECGKYSQTTVNHWNSKQEEIRLAKERKK